MHTLQNRHSRRMFFGVADGEVDDAGAASLEEGLPFVVEDDMRFAGVASRRTSMSCQPSSGADVAVPKALEIASLAAKRAARKGA